MTIRNAKHAHRSLAAERHWEATRLPATGAFFRALRVLVPDATALYVEGSQLSSTARSALQGHADWSATVIPRGEGWPTNWYEALRLVPSELLFEVLARLADAESVASLGSAGALFRDRVLLAEWVSSANSDSVDLLEVTEGISPFRIERFGRVLGVTPTLIAPAP